jgi:hypothetical protein
MRGRPAPTASGRGRGSGALAFASCTINARKPGSGNGRIKYFSFNSKTYYHQVAAIAGWPPSPYVEPLE